MWNADSILRIAIYFMLMFGLGYGLCSRRLLRYVAPRSIKYVLFMIVVLFFLFLMEFRNIRRIREKKMRIADYLFFLIPLLLAFTTAPVVVKGSAVKMPIVGNRTSQQSEKIKGSKVFSSIKETEKEVSPPVSLKEEVNGTKEISTESPSIAEKEPESVSSESKAEETTAPVPQPEEAPVFSAPVEAEPSEEDATGDEFIEEPYPLGEWTPVVPPKDGEVKVVDENNYFSVLTSIEEEGDKWNGKKIEISGFVHSDETLSDREFLLVRMLMKCCAVDTDPMVLLSVLPQGMQMPKNDEWFVLRGTLRTKPIVETGFWVPTLEVEVMAPIPEPENYYIYPI